MAEILDINKFNEICDELISGKYILVDIKISSLLNTINEEEKIKNIISTSLQGYDFSYNFDNSIKDFHNSKRIIAPSEEKDIIAYVYSILHLIKNKEISLYEFLLNYFSGEDVKSGDEFKNFCSSLIVPFKNAINSIYSKRHVIVETDDYKNNIYNKLKTTIELIYKNIDNYKLKLSEKEEFSMLLNSLHTASEHNNKKLVYSLMIGLDYFTKANKKQDQHI